MKTFIKMFFASLLAMLFLFVVVVGIVAVQSSQKSKIKDGSYLVVDLHGEILSYYPPDDIIAEILGGEPETVHRILDNLDKAAVDERIAGAVLRISSSNTLGLGAVEEIRSAIGQLREAGKPVYAFADDLDRQGLLLAAACDSIFMPHGSQLYFVGFGGTRTYVRGMLDKLGIEPNLHRIDEYKSAAELVLRKDMSPETREMVNWIYDDLWDSQMKAIADGRGIARDKIEELMEYALFLASEARDAGLIDGVRYWDEIDKMLTVDDEKKMRAVSQSRYAEVERSSLGLEGKKKIAVIHAQGTIGGRNSRVDPMLGLLMGHETVGRELRRARKDEDVVAVVFRIDSPGGESLASDLIGREVELLAETKPVVASMIDVGASGGYHIAYKASKIMADPMTITGSIGSISGKMNMVGLYNKLGITYDFVGRGPNGFLFSPYQNFTDQQRQRFEDNHWKHFNLWFDDVARRRGIAPDKLKDLAMGRIWTGRQAAENGLIDAVGTFDDAVSLAKELAELDADEEVTFVHYPKKQGLLEMISSGGPKAAVSWMAYRYIREDLAQTLQLLMSGPQLRINP